MGQDAEIPLRMGSILGPVSDDNVLLYVRITSCSTVMENLVSVAVWYISEVECNFVEICTLDILIIQLLLGVGYCYYSVPPYGTGVRP